MNQTPTNCDSRQRLAALRDYVSCLVILVGGIILALFVAYLVEQGMHRGRFEAARRSKCRDNLRRISELLSEHDLEMNTGNLGRIQNQLPETDLRCPSASEGKGEEAIDGVYIVEAEENGGIVITESPANHDPDRFYSVSLPHVRHCLDADGQVSKIVLGPVEQ